MLWSLSKKHINKTCNCHNFNKIMFCSEEGEEEEKNTNHKGPEFTSTAFNFWQISHLCSVSNLFWACWVSILQTSSDFNSSCEYLMKFIMHLQQIAHLSQPQREMGKEKKGGSDGFSPSSPQQEAVNWQSQGCQGTNQHSGDQGLHLSSWAFLPLVSSTHPSLCHLTFPFLMSPFPSSSLETNIPEKK